MILVSHSSQQVGLSAINRSLGLGLFFYEGMYQARTVEKPRIVVAS